MQERTRWLAVRLGAWMVAVFASACGASQGGAGDGASSGPTEAAAPSADGATGETGASTDGADDASPTDTVFVHDIPPYDPDAVVPDDVTSPDAAAATDVADATATPDAPLPPARRDPPPLRAYSRGACPMLTGGPTATTSINADFPTGSQRRAFRLIVPRSYDGSSDWPVVFLWHWLNASSASFIRDGELESAAEQMHFIAVLPDSLRNSNGDRAYQFNWPFAEIWGIPSELQFFDDLLACVSHQYRVDRRRVHAVGVSAGGLWVTYLSTTDRADYFASVESLSGGLGEIPLAWRMMYAPQPNKFPALVLWGGTSDWLILDFNVASQRYRDALRADRHFVVQCTHGSGHALPPIPVPADGSTRFRPLWQFLLDHPYGMPPNTSPYLESGLPSVFPPWCSIAR